MPSSERRQLVRPPFRPNLLLSDWLRNAAKSLLATPWWLRIGLLYLVTRLISFFIFSAAALHQGPNPWFPAAPGYLDFINIWDSEWYHRIFDNLYPQQLPQSADGSTAENNWAFYPLFPLLVRGISMLTGLGWGIVAPLVATLAGLAASLMIYRLFRLFASTVTASWAMVFLLTFPISPILQVPYAESLNLFFLAAALYLVIKHRYLLAIPVVLLSALSRPVGVAFALFFFLHLLVRFLPSRRFSYRLDDFPASQRLTGLLLLLVSGVAAFAWPLIAWLVTGQMSAYTDTEAVWRGGGSLVLFQPWLQSADQLLGPVLGALALVLLIIGFVLYYNSQAVRRIGLDMRLWCLAYLVYLFAVLHPQTSTFRLMLPLFPFALATAFISRSRAFRIAVTICFLLLQVVWVVWLWAWAQLPGGGDYPP
ncbi:hypothetical protein [Psychromicrobium lacuslunae]|uniref:hypothetical protein n=1 Tax=Psychromicrobium lacuslunae TaxID=1618207 RepID=UPI001F33F088|nr:hypothetical protein [Psychromicrobium lacuslunae]